MSPNWSHWCGCYLWWLLAAFHINRNHASLSSFVPHVSLSFFLLCPIRLLSMKVILAYLIFSVSNREGGSEKEVKEKSRKGHIWYGLFMTSVGVQDGISIRDAKSRIWKFRLKQPWAMLIRKIQQIKSGDLDERDRLYFVPLYLIWYRTINRISRKSGSEPAGDCSATSLHHPID